MQANQDMFLNGGTSSILSENKSLQQYEGPSYSVKYLGIVDGSMGVLSRKMAMLSYNNARNVQQGLYTGPSSTSGGGLP